MERQIKFRGKSLRNGEWIVGQYHTYGDGTFIGRTSLMSNDGRDWRVPAIEVEPKSVGQFTGLFDKNKKEIYEGDILLCIDDNIAHPSEKNLKVFYNKWGFVLQYGISFDYYAMIEVVGNVCDNSELLNTK